FKWVNWQVGKSCLSICTYCKSDTLPETPWKNIALEFNLPPSTAPNFYKRECLPRLRNFAKNQGYLE
ncbi:hypothetical protein QUA30_26805, partial [Microcoleus sp. Pol14C2]